MSRIRKALANAGRSLIGTPLERPVRAAWMGYLRLAKPEQYETQKRAQTLDGMTGRVLEALIGSDSNCIDIGSYYGVILQEMLRIAPHGKHYAFEPNANLATRLIKKFPQVKVLRTAVGDTPGDADYFLVPEFPAQSGLHRRHDYPNPETEVETVRVSVTTLDAAIPEEHHVDLIKMDAEGAEFKILRGAVRILSTVRPTVIFEFGRAARMQGVTSQMLWELLSRDHGYELFAVSGFLRGDAALDQHSLEIRHRAGDALFVAFPNRHVSNSGGYRGRSLDQDPRS